MITLVKPVNLLYKKSKKSTYFWGIAQCQDDAKEKWCRLSYYTFSGWQGRLFRWTYWSDNDWFCTEQSPKLIVDKIEDGYTYVRKAEIDAFPEFSAHFDNQAMMAMMAGTIS